MPVLVFQREKTAAWVHECDEAYSCVFRCVCWKGLVRGIVVLAVVVRQTDVMDDDG